MLRHLTSHAPLSSVPLRGLSLTALVLALLLCLPAKPLWAAAGGNTVVNNEAAGGSVINYGDIYFGTLAGGGNKLVVTGGTSAKPDPGSTYACSDGGALTNNTLTIKGGSVGTVTTAYHYVAGSYGFAGDASNSHVIFEGGSATTDPADARSSITIFGGSGSSATDNSVIINGGTINGAINMYGGYAETGDATNNKVEINNAITVTRDIVGGYADTGNATGNSVLLAADNTIIDSTVYGGAAGKNATGNSVRLTGSNVTLGSHMYGGRAQNGNTTDNKILLASSGGKIKGSVNGGYAITGNAENNSVEITAAATVGGALHGGYAVTGNATGNSVLLAAAGTTIAGNVSGGTTGNGQSSDNTVKVTGQVTITKDLHGGAVITQTGNATGNSVLLAASGTRIDGNVYGGAADQGNASNNTVEITAPVTIGGKLYGGYSDSGTSSGNTLIVRSGGINVGDTISHFQNYYFYLTDSMKGQTLITAGGAVELGATLVGAAAVQGSTGWSLGDKVTLIKSTAGITPSGPIQNNFSAMSGISKVYDFGLEIIDGKNLVAQVTEVKKSDEVIRKSPAEGNAASVTTVTQGADLVAGKGMTSAREAVKAAGSAQSGGGLATFGAVSGGASTYNTGSHVDVQGFTFMAGIAKRLPMSGVDALLGVFFETGFGSYNSYNDRYDGGGEIRGWGNSRYYGGGLMGRLELTEGAAKGLYTEFSARMGSLYSDYRSDDLNPSLGQASYDINSLYYGVHAGLGYIWQMTDKASLDLYGKYFWTHTKGGDVRILGDPVTFDDVDSHRVRAGARFSYAANEHVAPYVGAAWEHEFAGDARSTVAGESVAAPSLKGSTGLGELGITWKPTGNDALSVDLGAQGYIGMRQGISGSLQMKLEF